MTVQDTDQEDRRDTSRRFSFGSPGGGFVLKLLFLAAVNGLAVFALPRMISEEAWLFAVVTVVTTLAIDYIYLSRRASTLPLKYLLPGTVLLLVFQVWPVLNTAYIAFTNFGQGNLLTFDAALDRIIANSKFPTADDPRLPARPLGIIEAGAVTDVALFLIDEEGVLGPPGTSYIGTSEELNAVDPGDIVREGDRVVSVGDFTVLNLGQVTGVQAELEAIEAPFEDSIIRLTQGISGASVVSPTLEFNEDTGELFDSATGLTYTQQEGNFIAEDGTVLFPGWRAFIGTDNFNKVLTSNAIRGPFLRVFVWTFVFAVGSVALTFAVGLGLAITLNHPDMRGQRIYRSLMVIPYALPSFLSALIWAGLLNKEFGIINEFLNLDVAWLRDPWLAKASILLVNTWLGFPYMFLVSTGALQAIPDNLKEAAAIDGATSRQSFRKVTFPLLMVALAPLLIASFAFNFNNFNVVFLLTGGGPPIAGAETPAGHTDILISYTFRLAFEGGSGEDFGLAAAVGLIIFVLVATMSGLAFRRTKVFEEINE